jgi:hypothetical protein
MPVTFTIEAVPLDEFCPGCGYEFASVWIDDPSGTSYTTACCQTKLFGPPVTAIMEMSVPLGLLRQVEETDE